MLALVLPFVTKNWKACLIGAASLVVVGFLVHERSVLIQKGATQAIEQVQHANQLSQDRAALGSKDVDGCYAAHGTWDRSRGVCVGPVR